MHGRVFIVFHLCFYSQGLEGRHRQQPRAADHQPHPDERPVPQIIRQVSLLVIIRKISGHKMIFAKGQESLLWFRCKSPIVLLVLEPKYKYCTMRAAVNICV